jgi:prepilin-type N-terminal cleavage/methylation domain-containing protein
MAAERDTRGVTLLEMLIVVAIAGAMATLVLPAFSNGLESLRLSQASDSVAAFLSGALNRAQRRQQVIEISIDPRENAILLRSTDAAFSRRLDMPDGVTIQSAERRIVLLPGSAFPRATVELANRRRQRRVVSLDPITGVPNIEWIPTP